MRRAASGSPRASAPHAESGLLQGGLAIIRPRRSRRSNESPRQLSVYDPKTREVDADRRPASRRTTSISAKTTNNTLWTSAGRPWSGVVGWLNDQAVPGDRRLGEVARLDADHRRHQRQREARRVCRAERSGRSRRRTSASSAAFYGVHAEPGRRLDLGPVDGHRLRARRPARLHHPPRSRARSRRTPRSPRSIVPPEGDVELARHRHDQRRRGVDAAGERAHRELRPQEVQGPAERAAGRDRQAVPRRLDALPHARAAVQGRGRGGQRRTTPTTSGSTASTRSGSATNVPIAQANGSESLMAVVDGKIVDIRVPYPLGLLHQARRRPHRRSERRLEGQGPVDHVRHAHRVPQRRRHREPARRSTSCRCGRIRSRADA